MAEEVKPKEPAKSKKSLIGKVRQGLGAVWDFIAKELGPTIEHGKSEVAAAMYSGNAFVVYGHDPSVSAPQQNGALEQLDAKAEELAKEQEGQEKSKSKGAEL